MKKPVSILLLLVFAMHILGGFTIFYIEQECNYYEVMEKQKSNRIELKFSKGAKIIYSRNGKEIIVGNQMYDVISKTEKGNEIIFNCIHDKKEEQLSVSLNHVVDVNFNNHQSKNNSTNSVKFSLIKDYLPESLQVKFCMNLVKEFSDTHSCKLIENSFEIITPPPQIS